SISCRSPAALRTVTTAIAAPPCLVWEALLMPAPASCHMVARARASQGVRRSWGRVDGYTFADPRGGAGAMAATSALSAKPELVAELEAIVGEAGVLWNDYDLALYEY